MIEFLYILLGVVTGTLFAFYVLKSKMKSDFQYSQAETGKAYAAMEERLKAREAEVNDLRNEYSAIKSRLVEAEKGANQLFTEKAVLEQDNMQIPSLKAKLTEAELKAEGLMKEKSSLAVNLSEIETRLNEEQKHSGEKLQLLQESKEQLKLEFKDLSNKILEEKSQKFTAVNKENMSGLLNPLKDQIKDFSKKVDECYNLEAKERHTLKSEIKSLQELNTQLSEDALNLTKALKGDTKAQGTWGELILEKILEASGLTKGREYETQEGVRNADGRLLKPDVIVHLPEDRDVIIDSKVSLVAYEQFCSTTDEAERQKAQTAHVISVRNHIRSLSEKNYDEVRELKSLDYVLLFMPVEGAFRLAIESDEKLFMEAYEKNIMLVSPSTLLITLRTINKIWQYEHQNRYALEIAKKAETLHAKFVGFIENLDKVGKSIQNSQAAYDQAHKQLCSGRGNIVITCQSLEKLGVNAKKKISASLLDKATISEELDLKGEKKLTVLESAKKS